MKKKTPPTTSIPTQFPKQTKSIKLSSLPAQGRACSIIAIAYEKARLDLVWYKTEKLSSE